MDIALLLVTLVVILVGAEVFTNGLEYLGERLKISEGVTGSIFAAIGTALPCPRPWCRWWRCWPAVATSR